MSNNQQPVVLPAVLRPSLLEVFGFWYVDSLFEGCFSTSDFLKIDINKYVILSKTLHNRLLYHNLPDL